MTEVSESESKPETPTKTDRRGLDLPSVGKSPHQRQSTAPANNDPRIPANLGRATLQFDLQRQVHLQDQKWRSQRLLKERSPRLFPTTGMLISSGDMSKLAGKSDDEVLQALLDDKVLAGRSSACPACVPAQLGLPSVRDATAAPSSSVR